MRLCQGLRLWGLALALSLAAVVTAWYAPAATAAAEAAAADQACLSCHGNQGLSVERGGEKVSLYVTAEALSNSVHAANSCTSCHTEQAKIPHDPVDARAWSLQVARNCQACHAEAGKDYQAGIHAQAGTATCASCHGSHDIRPATDPASPAARQNVVATCNKCHGESYVAESYAESFHGKAVSLGSSTAATCVSCHGAHAILPASDPASTVAKANIPQTCATCHGTAQANLAAGKEHFELKPEGDGMPMFFTFQFFTWLTILAMTLLIIHMELELWRRYRNLSKGSTGGPGPNRPRR